MIVLDASAVVELLLGGERGGAVERRLEEVEGPWHAPALMDIEVTQVLRRWEAAGMVGPARARAALEILAELPVRRHHHTPLLPRVWALRANLTAYDAAYLALAEALGCPILTCDRRMGAAPGVEARVVVA